jgi:type IV pilus assembly protein PilY1
MPIGFALPTGTNPTSLDIIAAAGGTGTAFLADDPASLQAAFDSIFLDILAKTGASSSAATNSTSLSTNSFIYQARFNSGDWNGQLLAKSISLSGVIDPVAAWDAAMQLNAKLPNDRVILTYGRDTNDGIPFRWSNINGLTDSTAFQ